MGHLAPPPPPGPRAPGGRPHDSVEGPLHGPSTLCLVSAASAADLTVLGRRQPQGDVMTDSPPSTRPAAGTTSPSSSAPPASSPRSQGSRTGTTCSSPPPIKQVEDLVEAGFADPPPAASSRARRCWCSSCPPAEGIKPSSFSVLADARFAKIAIGDPKSVPAGD